MKKISKITALILAILCVGTCCFSCGENKNEIQEEEEEVSKESKEEMANKIRNSLTIKTHREYYSVLEEKMKSANPQEFNAAEIFNLNGKSISEFGKTIDRPADFQKDYKVSINQEERKIIINFHTQVQQFWKKENIIFEICLPYKVKSTNKGIISPDDNKVVILEYNLENIKTKILTNAIGMSIYPEVEMWEEDGCAVIEEIIIKY